MVPDGFVLIGKVVGAHGLKGAVKIFSYAESSTIYQRGLAVLLVDTAGRVINHTEVLWADPVKKGVRIAFEGIGDRNAAEAVLNASVYVEKTILPELEEDTYYWSDLIGLSVYDEEKGYLGKLSSIMPTGNHDVYVITDASKGADYEVLIPALATVVTSVDLVDKSMHVKVPDGLMPM